MDEISLFSWMKMILFNCGFSRKLTSGFMMQGRNENTTRSSSLLSKSRFNGKLFFVEILNIFRTPCTVSSVQCKLLFSEYFYANDWGRLYGSKMAALKCFFSRKWLIYVYHLFPLYTLECKHSFPTVYSRV